MASLLSNAVRIGHAAAARVAGEPGKYRRGAGDCQCTAIPLRHLSEDYGDDAAAVASLRDWRFDPAELKINGDAVTPQLGDLFLPDSGGAYVVVYGDGENCWRWTDQTQQFMRVHFVERSAAE